jgi:hypothetical protein
MAEPGAESAARETLVEGGSARTSLAEARGWVGFEVDEAGGARAGRVHAVYVDAEKGDEPTWLIVALGRRRVKLVAVPLRDCAGAGERVWVAHDLESLRTAPAIDPARPLLKEHETAICSHYGIGERVGRAAEVAGRPEGSATSRPAA